MARFLAAIEGNRGPASRLGSASSGIRAQAQGWNVGVKVFGNDEDGEDVFRVYATSGSSYAGVEIYLGKVTLENGDVTWKGSDAE